MSWLSDASANRLIQCYAKNFVDVSGNFRVRNGLDISGGTVRYNVSNIKYTTSQLGQDLVGASAEDGFGSDVAMNEDGTIMVVGAFAIKANNGTSRAGAAYVYEDISGTWTLKGSMIKPFSTATTDMRFGESVGINNAGNIIVVGALSGYANYSSSDRASITAYEFTNGSWVQKGSRLNASSQPDGFSMVAINKTGDMIAGTAPGGGYVKVYKYTNSDWSQIGNFSIQSSTTIYPGRYRGALSFCDDIPRFAFGDVRSNSGNGSVSVYDYDENTNTWTQVGSTITVTMAASSANIEEGFGTAVSLNKDGTLLAIGAIDGGIDGTEDGDARVFQYNSGTSNWVQLGETLHKDTSGDEGAHGCIVKLDHTGTLLAVANYYYEVSDTGNGLYRGGAIFIYKYRNNAWEEVIYEQYDRRTLQYWGDGMTLSKDGTRFAGSTQNGDYADITGIKYNDGVARAFKILPPTLSEIPIMDISYGVVDISGTTWMNRGQSGASIASAYQNGLVIESSSTSASDAVLHIETAGQTQAFSVRGDGSVYSANTLQHSSDDRRKINEQYITNATETIKKLSPQIYTKLNDFEENGGTLKNIESGLIAQEIYYNAPELRHLVHTDGEPQPYDLSGTDIKNDPDYTALNWGDKSATVNYIGLLPYIIKSNQEQQEIIDNKQQLLDNKKALEEEIQSRIAALEA